jgi:ATP-dependent DNA helicase RecQ
MQRGYQRVALFTGDTPARERRRIVDGWAKDSFDIAVATSAFGMGIDKPDIRAFVHACLPEGPARWYQKIGRASRDGGQGLAACLFVDDSNNGDIKQAYGLATWGWLTRAVAQERWLAMLKSAANRYWVGDRLLMSIDLDAFREGLRPKAGDWNRGWNMTLLSLLQRAGVLRVLSIAADGDQPEFVWDVEIIDHRLLNGVDADVWDEIETPRVRWTPFVRQPEPLLKV